MFNIYLTCLIIQKKIELFEKYFIIRQFHREPYSYLSVSDIEPNVETNCSNTFKHVKAKLQLII